MDGTLSAPGMGGSMTVNTPAPPPIQTTDTPSQGSVPQQAQPAPPPMSPQQQAQQADIQHHALLGKVFQNIMGNSTSYQVDPSTGQTVATQTPNKPGQFFKAVLAASLLGGEAGANGNPAQGFMGGVVRGAGAEQRAGQQQDALKRQQAQQQFNNENAADKNNREATYMNAQLAQMHAEMVARQHTSDLADEKSHLDHNKAAAAVETALRAAHGIDAPIVTGDGVKSTFTAPDLVAAYTKDPSILRGPDPEHYVRHFLDTTDASELSFNGTNWVTADGDPANMTDHTTVKAIDVPIDAMNKPVLLDNKDINAARRAKILPVDGKSFITPLGMDAQFTKGMADAKANQAGEIAKRKVDLEGARLSLEQAKQRTEEAKNQKDTEGGGALVDEIGMGKMPVGRMNYLMARNPTLLNQVAQKYPNFDGSKVDSYLTTYKDFTDGKASVALNAGATALKHLHELDELNTPESHIPHTPDWNRYQNKADTLSTELAKFYGDATIPAIAAIKGTLVSTLPGNRHAAITTQAKSMGDKFDSYEQTWRNAAPSSAYEAPMPGVDVAAKAARAALDPDYAKRFRPVNGQPTGATMKVPGSDGRLHWSDGKNDLGVAQ